MDSLVFSVCVRELAKVAGLEKTALTRQAKILKALVAKGDIGAANALAKKLHRAGALKVSGPGTQLKTLGGGAEGVAHTVIGAKDAG